MWGPDARHGGPYGGLGSGSPADGGNLLLTGVETAVPAIMRILEQLPANATGEALMEVPQTADMLKETAPAGMRVTWLPGRRHGTRSPADRGGRGRRARPHPAGRPLVQVEDVDIDEDILWEIPETPPAACSVELAGEAGVVKIAAPPPGGESVAWIVRRSPSWATGEGAGGIKLRTGYGRTGFLGSAADPRPGDRQAGQNLRRERVRGERTSRDRSSSRKWARAAGRPNGPGEGFIERQPGGRRRCRTLRAVSPRGLSAAGAGNPSAW